MVTKDQYDQNQLQQSVNAYASANPDIAAPTPKDQGNITNHKNATALDNIKFGSKYLASKALQGIVDMTVSPVNYLNNKLGFSSDAETARISKEINDGKGTNMGLQPEVAQHGTDIGGLNVAGDLVKMAPAIVSAETSGGASFYLQGMGATANEVAKMKANGVKFNNHSDDLLINGAGLINYVLGKSVASTILSKMGTGFSNDVIGRLSAEATKELADLGAKATTEDIANLYVGKALQFSERLQQLGLDAVKTLPKIGTEFAGANLANSALKAGVNKLSGNNPLGDVTGDEIAKDVISPFYNNDTPANGNLGQFALNMVTSPAAGLSMLHGAMNSGMLFDKSPVKNAVIESLQKDPSPHNVEAVKAQIEDMGLKKGWTDDEIANTKHTVDALADLTSKIPHDMAPGKFYDATNLILGRRQLQAILEETQNRKAGIDPALTGKTAAFETLLNSKIEQANDKLDELVTDKKYTYTDDNGKYYKTKPGGEPIEITKDRFDLEEVENKSRPEAQKTKVITIQPGDSKTETKKQPVETVATPQDIPQEKPQPATDSSMLDDLDAELDNFKQPKAEIESTTNSTKDDTQKPEIVTKTPESVNSPASEDVAKNATTEKVEPKKNSYVSDSLTDEDYKGIKTGSEGQAYHYIARNGHAFTLVYGERPDGESVQIIKESDNGKPVEHEYPGWKEPGVAKQRLKELLIKAGGIYTGPSVEPDISAVIDDRLGIKEQKPSKPSAKPSEKPSNPSKPSPYYVTMPEGHQETPGKPVPNDHGLDLFTHNLEDIGGKGYGVSEGSTGLSIATGSTEAEAIAGAHDLLKTKTPAEMQAIIKAKHESGLQSPRGIIRPETNDTENSDTENTEAVIAKATATVGKAKATTGGKTEPTGIINEIDESLDSIDKELKNENQKVAVTHNDLKKGDPFDFYSKVLKKYRTYVVHSKDDKGVNFSLPGKNEISLAIRNEAVDENLKDGRLTEHVPQNEPSPEPEAAKEEPQQDAKSEKRKKYEDELKAAKKAFMDTFNKALSGINPETLEKGIKLIAVYAKIGIHDFKEIASDLATDLGENIRDIFEGLKASYGAYAGQEASEAELDQMTDIREVRKANIEDFLKTTKNDTGRESNTLAENSPELDEGQPTGRTTGNVEKRPVEKLPGSENDRGGKTGNAVKAKQDEPVGSGPSGSGNDTGTGKSGAVGGPAEPNNGPADQSDAEKRTIAPADRNHIIKPEDTIVPSGAVGKFNANVDALFLLKKLEAEDRNATPEEKKTLAQFVGWGGLSKYLDTPNRADNEAVGALLNGTRTQFYDNRYNRVTLDYSDQGPLDVSKYASFDAFMNDARKQLTNSGYAITPDNLRAPLLKSLLTNAEYQGAQNSTINAHYTHRAVISNMWDLAGKLGFKGGKVLESSAGIGHFFGLMPKEFTGKTSLQAYELDSITGRLLQKLYPQSNTTVTGFQNARVPQNSVDLAIGNVPFAAKAPYDKNFPDLSKFSMHNYFIAKNLKLLKPGGIAVMITSSSTMDSPASAKFREWVTAPDGGNSYLVGAMRFPNNAFSENAGTEVTTDMLVFQKKGQVVNAAMEQPFRYTRFLKTGKDSDGNQVDLHVNEYYHEHPEQMLGEMMTAHEAGSGGLYGSDNATLKAPAGFDINKEIKKANNIFPEGIAGNRTEPEKVEDQPITALDKKEGSLFIKNGKPYRVVDGDGVQVPMDAKQQALTNEYIGLKGTLLKLINDEQTAVESQSGGIEKQRAELNTAYDKFVKKYGNINGRTAQFLNDVDIDYPIVSSLENIARSIETKDGKDRIVSTITKGEILQKRINFPRTDPTSAKDVKDAINISLNYRNGLDINYMAKMLGEEPDAVRERMLNEELAYENPDTGILETPEEYLSGYVRDKLKKAEIASTNDPIYLKNVAQLKKVIPEDIPASLISYSLGSSWIPGHVYEQFAKDTLEANMSIKYLDKAGKFLITRGYGSHGAAVQNRYAAGGQDGIDILEATLNNKQIIVSDTVIDTEGKKRQVKNPQKTAAAQAMQVTMQEEFEQYVRNSEPIQHETERIYNDVFNGQVLRTYRIPDFKHYPGASTTVTLREHQKRAVSRNLVESTLDAHEVGSGKTYTIITTAMEMRRLGTARKPLIGVQNSTLSDFLTAFKQLYPAAKILSPTAKEMEADGRKKLFAKIATGDWDAIILPHSQITMIPDDPERQKAYIMEQIEEMKGTIESLDNYQEKKKMEYELKLLQKEMDKLDGVEEKEEGGKSTGKSAAKKIGEKSLKIQAGMEKAFDRKVDNVLNFEQLGIDAMLMDEAHKYKRLGFQTSMQNIKGIDTSKSQRSQSILLKSRWIQEKTGGKNVNFFTGTPISNTMAEAWTMMKYLRPDILEHMGIEYFDQFAKTFGQVIPSLEQTGGGTFKVQSRFAKFQNLPEFINAFRAMTDVVLTSDVKEFQNTDTIPKLKNGVFTQVVLPQSPELKVQINEFKRTLEWFDKLTGAEKRENRHIPLVIYNKAKQASIDLRLLDPTNVDSPQSKVNNAVDNAYRIYKEHSATKGVQMIFSDMYQSPEPKDKYLDEDGFVVNPAYGKDRFNLFEDIKKKLVAKGVPADQIVIFTEAKYDKAERKKAVFNDANSGKIRFLLGTTEKMGVGVNAQQKLVALHHLDAPPRPMDFEQRNGRIIRQGNENKIVDVLTYGVEKTLDSSAFQRLSTKQKFINQIMKGENLERVTEDPADEAQLTFDEMMAHLSDSPYAMQKLMVDNKLKSEVMKQQNFQQKIIRTNRILRDTEGELKRDRAKLVDQIKYAEIVRTKIPDGNVTSIVIHGQPEITEKFGECADAYVQKLVDKYFNSPTKFAKGGFDLNGMRVELEVVNKEKSSKETGLIVDTPMLQYTIPEVGLLGESWSSGGIEIPSNSGTGLLSSIRSKLDSVLVKPASTQSEINQAEKDIEVLRKDTKATFDTTKMKELETESEALKAKMLADTENNPPPDDTPNGGQTPGEYIRDQSNIKGALDFLDNMKAKNDGKFLSTIVPIPPAVWNGAIDVMKNILKATNSTQKAIRVAGQYIIDRGGTEAQAKDFEATLTDKMAKTHTGKVATAADSEDATGEDILKRAALDLQTKMKDQQLSPDEREFAGIDVSKLTAKELHRYIEVASVLSVDPQGVLTKNVTDLMDRVANRISPKGGTAVPPPPDTPTGGNGNLMDDDEPRRRIPKKEKLPMENTESLPEQTGEDGKPVGKENYSAIGRFKDIRVRNLEQLKQYGLDMGNLSALRDVRQYATSKSQASIVMKTATDRIIKTVGKAGWDLLRQALVESRLRGIRQRWETWSKQIKATSDNELDELFQDGKQSMMYDIISRLDGYEDDPKPEQTILGMLSNDEYDDVREYLGDMFANAAQNVAFFDKLSNGKTFDEIVKDQQFIDPKMQEAFEAYKSLMAKPFEESHAANEGIFSDALGPLDTYYPLVPTGGDKHYVVTPGSKYRAPENPNNKFATGQGNTYSTALSDLSNRLANAIRTSNKANAIHSLESAGLIAKVTKDSPDDGLIDLNGTVYTAKKVLVQDSKILVTNGRAVALPARYVLMPNWLYKEVKPIFEDTGSLHDDFSLFGRINNIGIKLMLGGPIEATSHSYRLLGGIVNSMPYMQEWAYKHGVLGHAGGLVLNNPFVKTFAGMGHILFTDISSDEALETIQEMAKIGVIPEKTWQKTWSKEFAELTGAKKVPLWDWSPILYGKHSIDLKARVLLYRLSKAMNPDATPEQLVKMQNELGNYTMSLQGELEKFVKRHGLAPFYSFGGAIYRSGIKAVFASSGLPLTRPSLKDAFTTKMGAEQVTKLAGYKMAQLITSGIVGLIGYWTLVYHLQTGMWPWEDKHSKLLKTPFPEWAKNDLTRKMFMDKKSGAYPDFDFSFFNPFINRGIRAVGAPKAYETDMLGGTVGQSVEAGAVQAINTNLSPYTSSPAIQLGVTALTGDAPYITGLRDRYAGTPGIGFYRKVNTFPAGLQMPANVAVGAAGLNPLVDYALSPLTNSLKYKYQAEDQDAYTMANSVFNTIMPHLLTKHGSDEKKAAGIEKQQKAITTSMRKEEQKMKDK